VLAFLCEGGSKENQAYVLKFKRNSVVSPSETLPQLLLEERGVDELR
jgi:hypothetical protein